MRALNSMIVLVALMAASSASARKTSHHHSKHTVASKHQSAPKTNDRGGVERQPDDVALDRKIGSICRGC
jgi:hypothetical protein